MKNQIVVEPFPDFKYDEDGQFHCEYGPAVEWTDGRKRIWYIHGERLTEDQFKLWQIQNRKSKIEALEL